MPVFSAIGRILLMKAYGSLNSSQLGSKTGHSGGGLNSSGRGRLIVSDRPGGGSERTGHRMFSSKVSPCFVFFLKPNKIPFVHRQTRWQSVVINTRGGCLHTHTYTHSLSHTHTRSAHTHTNIHSHTHIHAQWGECSKAVSTSAQKTRHRALLMKARVINEFPRCFALHRLLTSNQRCGTNLCPCHGAINQLYSFY